MVDAKAAMWHAATMSELVRSRDAWSRWKSLAAWGAGLGSSLPACQGEESADAGFHAFAVYWADSSEWCAYLDDCGIQEQATCREGWPTVAETEEALAAADVDLADTERCEKAARSLDECALKLSCEVYQAGEMCTANLQNLQTACGPVNAALEIYLNEHRKPPFDGPFVGAYSGDEDGTFSGVLGPDGSVTIDIASPSLGEVNGEGTVDFSGAAQFYVTGDVADGDYSLSFTGTITGSESTFDGSGSWDSSTGDGGTWTLTSSGE